VSAEEVEVPVPIPKPAVDTATDRVSPDWHATEAAAVCAALDTDPEVGLSADEAEHRLAAYGPNQLEASKRTPAWRMFLSQFEDFMIYVLLAAVVISAVEGQTVEAIAILAILLLNGVLGFMQEYRAEQSLEALKELSAPTATVLRGGVEMEVRAEALVPGDVVLLEAGDRVPADGRLVETAALRMVEGALTGESEAVRKHVEPIDDKHVALGDRRNMVFASTSVAVGRGRFVVTETGTATEVGKIADLLAGTPEEATPLEVELEVVGKRIAILVLAIAAVIFAEEVFLAARSESGTLMQMFAHPDFRSRVTEGLLIAVSLAVAAIPEGLPAIVTVALSLGVRRMAEHNAIVRRLHAVETLGSTTFICSDKTGTLTLNRMTVRRMIVGLDEATIGASWGVEPAAETPGPEDLALLLDIAASCNDAHYTDAGELVGDPTETALVEAAERLAPGRISPRRIAEIPFDSERKRMTTVHAREEEVLAYVKGGADVVLALCTRARIRGRELEMTPELLADISSRNERLASTGFRTLALAFRRLGPDEPIDSADVERDLTYVGIVGLVDPARPEVPAAVDECHRAGIKVAMVTGDHALTARAIAMQVGVLDADEVVTGAELESMTDDELATRVEAIRVYARVDPEHKLRIVDALKRNGEVVAMTGDGVNDAPALKRADIGVAMGLVGTDVSREAADMVLADDNFATIVDAVGEGRTVFDNLRKVILFLLSCNMSEVLVVAITAIFSPNAALLPLQLLWINLVTDGLPALALGVDPADPKVMDRLPRASDESILTFRRQMQIVFQGAVMTAGALVLGYVVSPALGASPAESRTMLFCALVLTQLLHAFDFRSDAGTVFSVESLKNKWLVFGLIGSMALQALVVYLPGAERIFKTVPLSMMDWVAVAGTALAAIAIMDAAKLADARFKSKARGAA
jgi:Ca2+-transporting ATPase